MLACCLQLVWVATTAVGCAAELCSGAVIYACEYTPRGNTDNTFAFYQNVLSGRHAHPASFANAPSAQV
jgi:hypothetical protein